MEDEETSSDDDDDEENAELAVPSTSLSSTASREGSLMASSSVKSYGATDV